MSRLNRPKLTRHNQRPIVVLTRPRPSAPTPAPPPPPLNPNVKNFDINIAVELMEMCINSYQQINYYEKNGNLNDWTVSLSDNSEVELIENLFIYEKQKSSDNINIIKTFPIGFIAKKNNLSDPDRPDYYICFRGTETAKEWEDNLDFGKTKCSFLNGGEKVHKGFQTIYTIGGGGDPPDSTKKSIPQDVIMSFLNSLQTTQYRRLYVTGHSLGAALAALCVLDIVVNTVHKGAIMYNYAGPAVGDQKFATTFKNNIGTNFCSGIINNNLCSFRVVNINDLVPNLPPPKLGPVKLGYVHVNGCSGPLVCNNSSTNDTDANGLYLIEFGDKDNPDECHEKTTYLKILQNIRDKQ